MISALHKGYFSPLFYSVFNVHMHIKKYAVTIAGRTHLFPYRTQKLSSLALMILGGRPPGKARRCRLFWSYGQAVKTPPFHGGNPGSIPGRVTRKPPNSWDFSSLGAILFFGLTDNRSKLIIILKCFFALKNYLKKSSANRRTFSGEPGVISL